MSDGELVQVDLLETLVAEVRALRGDLQRRERGALNAREAAAFLGISDRTLGTLVRQGRIRQTRVSSGRVMYRLGELERYLKDHENELDPATEDDEEWLQNASASREKQS